ncbi:CrpP-related protein [Achromobacter sp. PD1]|uniref:CrpP-related protein n=1 Tax=Achromobacter sp. PD1 TaxID=3399125 RepID=UPI003AF8B9DD
MQPKQCKYFLKNTYLYCRDGYHLAPFVPARDASGQPPPGGFFGPGLDRGIATFDLSQDRHTIAIRSRPARYYSPDQPLLGGAQVHDDIRKQGAQAAREGATLLDCPFLKPEAMPGQTGESPVSWRERFEAWQSGWIAETRSRRWARDMGKPDS